MVNKIKTLVELPTVVEQIHNKHEKIVLVGGVFDILHPGHLAFFEQAKNHGDILILLLESDESVKTYKGKNRPIFSQKERAKMLAGLTHVDIIVCLQGILSDEDYYRLTSSIKPAIIAATKGDPLKAKKQEQAKLSHAHYVEVIDRMGNHSSSDIIKKLDL